MNNKGTTKVIKVHPLATMSTCTKFTAIHSIAVKIIHKSEDFSLFEEKSGDDELQQGSPSGDHECLYKME